MRITVCGVIQPQMHCKQSCAPRQRRRTRAGPGPAGTRPPAATSAPSPSAENTPAPPAPGVWGAQGDIMKLKRSRAAPFPFLFLKQGAMCFLLSAGSAPPQLPRLGNGQGHAASPLHIAATSVPTTPAFFSQGLPF